MSATKIVLKDYLPQEIRKLIQEMNEPSYRAEQILDWMYKKKAINFAEMTNLPSSLRDKLALDAELITLQLAEKVTSSKDGTEKFLFKTRDNEFIECALMKQDYGNTICVSSQIGCGLGCVFCASAKGGLVRNLSVGEMIDQVILAEKKMSGKDKINNIVVMGMGEPLHNLSNLLKFLEMLNSDDGLGISFRNITVSTAGIAPQIVELAVKRLPITLAVSLHASDNETRSTLMPINKKYPLEELLASCKLYVDKVGRRITFEYILLKDINDSVKQAKDLVHLLEGMLCHVNLIPANQATERELLRPPQKRIKEFHNILDKNGIPVSIRREQGADIEGACGQLRRRYYEKDGIYLEKK